MISVNALYLNRNMSMNYDAVGAVPLWSYECYRLGLVMECV